MDKQPNIRIIHPRWYTRSGKWRGGRCTIAYNREGRTITLATSFCSEKDRFKRKTGIAIASARLIAGEGTIRFDLPINEMSGKAINTFILDTLNNAELYGFNLKFKPCNHSINLYFLSNKDY